MPHTLETLTRRRLIQLGAGGALGLNLGGLLRADTAPTDGPPPVRACILVFQYGGPSQLDTFDMKPDAPAEVRGEFKPIDTTVPGLQVCEHLPRMARLMHRTALVRTMTHQARLHDSASIHALTGRPLDGPDRELFAPQPQFFPSIGGAVTYMNLGRGPDVPFAALPFAFRNVVPVPCQGGGFLGPACEPLQIDVDPATRAYKAELLSYADGLTASRSLDRRRLLEAVDSAAAVAAAPGPLRSLYDRAYRLLENQQVRDALDLSREPESVRQRYGFGSDPASVGEGGGGGNGAELGHARQMRGQNLLLARRLVEAGVPFVNVYDFRQQGQNWDAHFKCFNQHKSFLLPQADQGLSALIEDLDARGLLDSTLVVAMGEFGRTPRINADGGRDHWPDCYTALLAGGGVTGGAIHGASDRLAAYPSTDPVTPGDLAATVFWRFGLDHSTLVHDPLGRPQRLATGEPLKALFGAS